jgi:threonylcarbamoyladenosine tRNA methylthiotransferase MtaB
MKIWSYTFGCKVNQYETELLRHRMTGKSDSAVTTPAEADICLINTCSVTAFADKEARQMIRRVIRENEHARVVVTGCYATRAPKEVAAISNRVEIYTNQEKEELPSCVGFEVAEKPLGIHHFAGHTRAFLKVQDGCKAPCNYCIIPTVRPDMWSKPTANVLAEAEALLANGYQEIVLTGIRLGLYRGGIVSLLEKLVAIPKQFRIRLSSLEVTEVTDDLIDFVSKNPKICRHFHIPMQSGDSTVLKDMGRWYDAPYYRSRIEAVKKVMPDCGLTADVMVGYPTETDELFLNTYHLIEQMVLSGLHVFRFSARETTGAAALKPLDPRVIQKRAGLLGELDKALRERFYRRFEGTQRETLPEPSGEGWTDNYIRVEVPEPARVAGLSAQKVWSPLYATALV